MYTVEYVYRNYYKFANRPDILSAIESTQTLRAASCPCADCQRSRDFNALYIKAGRYANNILILKEIEDAAN